MNPLSSELPFHIHNWLVNSLKDFCIVIRKWPTLGPSSYHKVAYQRVKLLEWSRGALESWSPGRLITFHCCAI